MDDEYEDPDEDEGENQDEDKDEDKDKDESESESESESEARRVLRTRDQRARIVTMRLTTRSFGTVKATAHCRSPNSSPVLVFVVRQ